MVKLSTFKSKLKKLKAEIEKFKLHDKYYLWYYAGCLILNGLLKEPFSSAELYEFCIELKLPYEDVTNNFFPQKHSINYGEKEATKVFVAGERFYKNIYHARQYTQRHGLNTIKNYRLDRHKFQDALNINGWKVLEKEIEKLVTQKDYGKIIPLLNKLQRKKKISSEQWKKYEKNWRESPQDREFLFQHLNKMLEEDCVSYHKR